MITCNVPKFYWGDAVLTATYLINRMPNKVISFETPLKMLQNVFHTTHLESNIPLRVFGSTVFVHAYSNNKLDSRAVKCIFIGYSPTQKGYKCFDSVSKHLFVSLDVAFHEDTQFYPKSSIQGERASESQILVPEPREEYITLEQ